ncbi:MAG TPA: F0F1 ATP synthase subunit gamma [Acidimicrobiales bacterium]|nr:F0F1 ATP synthase subunit gamma [Acidimicrobiales bacterium]
MAGGQERTLRRRIKSVQSTKKITKAMELIAASRIVKAQQRVAAARPYAEQITEVIGNLARAGAGRGSPLLEARDEVRSVGIVVVAADRGLAGGYNTQIIRLAERALTEAREAGQQVTLVTVGRKADAYFRFRGHDIAASFGGFTDEPTYEDARAVAGAVTERFAEGDIDRVALFYTRFVSLGVQRATEATYLPIDTSEVDEAVTEGPTADYEFEPSPAEILDRLLPRYAEARLYAALLESAASEHAARQRAMKSATDNAEELIVKLSRAMNRARQDAITTEIMEIIGGAESLREGAGGGEDLLVDRIGGVHDLLPDSLAR